MALLLAVVLAVRQAVPTGGTGRHAGGEQSVLAPEDEVPIPTANDARFVAAAALGAAAAAWPAHVVGERVAVQSADARHGLAAAMDADRASRQRSLRGDRDEVRSADDDAALVQVARLRVAFTTAWLDTLRRHAGATRERCDATAAAAARNRTTGAAARAAADEAARAAADNRLLFNVTDAGWTRQWASDRARLNAALRPTAVAALDAAAVAATAAAAAEAQAAACMATWAGLMHEVAGWEAAVERAKAALAAVIVEAREAEALRAELARLLAAGAAAVAAGRQAGDAPTPAGGAGLNNAASGGGSGSGSGNTGASSGGAGGASAISGVAATRPPPPPPVTGSGGNVAAGAAAALAAAARVVPSAPCVSAAACNVEAGAFAAASTVSYQRAAGAALALLAVHRGRVLQARMAALPGLYGKLAAAMRQRMYAIQIAGFDGEKEGHPGGAVAFLCAYVDLELREHCTTKMAGVVAAAEVKNMGDVVYCTVVAQSKEGDDVKGAGAACAPYLTASRKPAQEIAKGMHGSVDSARDAVKDGIKAVHAAVSDVRRARAGAARLLAAAGAPFPLPTSPVAANLLALQYAYYARRDAFYMYGRRAAAATHALADLAARVGVDAGALASGEVTLPPGPAASAADELIAAGDKARVDASSADTARRQAEQEYLAAQGRAETRLADGDAASTPPPSPATDAGGGEGGEPASLACPFGGVFCPALPSNHEAFWRVFNARKGGWRPDGVSDPGWRGSDDVWKGRGGGPSLTSFLESESPPGGHRVDDSCLAVAGSNAGLRALCTELAATTAVLAEVGTGYGTPGGARPDPYPDLFPNLFYPPSLADPGAESFIRGIQDATAARDATDLPLVPAGARSGAARPASAVAASSRGSPIRTGIVAAVPEGAGTAGTEPDVSDDGGGAAGAGAAGDYGGDDGGEQDEAPPAAAAAAPSGPKPLGLGQRVLIKRPAPLPSGLPPFLAAALPTMEPVEVEGYLTAGHGGSMDGSKPPTSFDVTLDDGNVVEDVAPDAMTRPAPSVRSKSPCGGAQCL